MSFPASHTTTTSPPPDATPTDKKVSLNKDYFRTNDGRFKVAHLIISLIVFISVMASYFPRSHAANWISFVSMSAFWTSAVLLFLYCINAVLFLSVVPWGLLEFGYTVIWTFFWFVAGCVAADYANRGAGDAFAVASFFSFVAMIIFGVHAFLYFKKWKVGSLFTTVTTTTTTTTTTTATATPTAATTGPKY